MLLALVCKRRTQPISTTFPVVRLHILSAKAGSEPARTAFQQRWEHSEVAFLSIVIGITCNDPTALDLDMLL